MDGWIAIGTNLETDKFDKQINELDKKIKREEDKKIVVETKLSLQEEDLEKTRKNTDILDRQYQKYKKLQKAVVSGNIEGNQFSQFNNFEKQYGSLENLGNILDKAVDKQVALEQKVEQTKLQYNQINDRVDNFKQKIEDINMNRIAEETRKARAEFEKANKTIKDQIKNVGKLALAVFSVRSAYLALRQASSTIAQYDQQYASNLEYIRYVLAMSIKPVLEGIVNLAYKLLQIINYIASAWFGVTGGIFKSAEAFKSAKNSLASGAKSAKEINKQLAGFDEMNIIQDNSSSSGSGGGTVAPSLDFGEEPTWVSKIAPWIAGIVSGLVAFKALKLLEYLGLIKKGIAGIKAIGIGTLIGGIVKTVSSLINYLKDPSWKNFGNIIQGVGIAIAGIGVIIGGVPAIVAGAVGLIVGTIVKYWEQIKGVLQKGADWVRGLGDKIIDFIDSKLDWIREYFGIIGVGIAGVIEFLISFITNAIANIIETIKNSLDFIFSGFKNILDGIIKMFKGDFLGGIKQVGQGIVDIFRGVWELVYGTFKSIWNAILKAFSNGGKIFNGLKEGIVNVFRTIVNALISGINKVVSFPFNTINGLLNRIKDVNIPVINVKPFSGLWGYNPLPVPQIPKLATGGIINYPNRGVGIGGMAIGGEAGREGVIPLTDSQAMETLGQAIGRYITINANITNNMNGRVISRQLQQIQGQTAFAGNL